MKMSEEAPRHAFEGEKTWSSGPPWGRQPDEFEPDEPCYSCNIWHKVAPLKAFSAHPEVAHRYAVDAPYPWKLLCLLCASTPAGRRVDRPREDSETLSTICYVGNMILAELRGVQDTKQKEKVKPAHYLIDPGRGI